MCSYEAEMSPIDICIVLARQKNLLWIADLENNTIGEDIKWDKLVDEFDAEFG